MSRVACALLVILLLQVTLFAEEDNPFDQSTSTTARTAASDVSRHKTSFQVPASNASNKPSARERIHAALESPTSVEFVETPLSDVVEYLKDVHKIEIQFDSRALEDAGAAVDTSIHKTLKNISLGAALRLMLEPLDLTYLIQNEVLLITSKDKADSIMEIKVYDVTDLVSPSTELNGDKLHSLANVIQSTAFPHTWKAEGGPGRLEPLILENKSTLVVTQSARGHEEINSLLTKLRQAKEGK